MKMLRMSGGDDSLQIGDIVDYQGTDYTIVTTWLHNPKLKKGLVELRPLEGAARTHRSSNNATTIFTFANKPIKQ